MPDWGKILGEIRGALVEAANEANARRQAPAGRGRTFERVYKANTCLFWDCSIPIRVDHFLCYDHFLDFREGEIDECSGCGLAKYAQYDVCLDCYRAVGPPQRKAVGSSRAKNRWYKTEYSSAWDRRDAAAVRFYVYILKLDGGNFYAGQTRELRERLSEHRDGKVQSTKGRNPKLNWFGIVGTREAAADVEVELKKLVTSNPREIRRMVRSLQDLVTELDFS